MYQDYLETHILIMYWYTKENQRILMYHIGEKTLNKSMYQRE